MSSYGDMAWTYSEEDIGIDPETNLTFIPNKKELDLFKQEKTDLYKGTWMVCFIYGLSAIILLSIIFLTEWGRNYIYDKFLPAVITYVIGAIFIIIYLVTSIFSLKPRKIGKGVEAIPICPDYWQLKETTGEERKDMKDNIQGCMKGDGVCTTASKGGVNNQYILSNESDPVINSEDSAHLQYKCVPDPKVFGTLDDVYYQKDELHTVNNYKKTTTNIGNDNKYIYRELGTSTDNSEGIKKYAQISGMYKNNWDDADVSANAHLFDNTIKLVDSASQSYNYAENPLICNVLYPGVITALEDTKNTDKLRCDYADKCGISWSKLDCVK